MRKKLLKLSIFAITLIQFHGMLSGDAIIAYGWNEMLCETGDFTPISLRGVWGRTSKILS